MHVGEQRRILRLAAAQRRDKFPASRPRSDYETLREMTALDNLCRAGLQKEGRDYDIADLIDLHANAVLGQRASDVTAMLEHAMEAGRRRAAR